MLTTSARRRLEFGHDAAAAAATAAATGSCDGVWIVPFVDGTPTGGVIATPDWPGDLRPTASGFVGTCRDDDVGRTWAIYWADVGGDTKLPPTALDDDHDLVELVTTARRFACSKPCVGVDGC